MADKPKAPKPVREPKGAAPANAVGTETPTKIEENATEVRGTPPAPSTDEPIVADIGARLGGQAQVQKKSTEGGARPGNPNPIADLLANMGEDNLRMLKAALNAVPERKIKKTDVHTVTMRFVEDKPVIKISNAYLGIVKDLELRREVERHLITIELYGDSKPREMLYEEFMKLPRIKCKVISSRSEEEEVSDDTVFSSQEGKEIELLRTVKNSWFTIELPAGENIELEEQYLNL